MQARGCRLAVMVMVTGCARPEVEPPAPPAASVAAADTAQPWRKPGDTIDSILPMGEYLRRFRSGLPTPARFGGGDSSREGLARRFLVAVSGRDTTAIRALTVSRGEFGWLVFPNHLYAVPPYELDPELFWMRLTAGNSKGLSRVLQRYGGRPLDLREIACQRDTLQFKSGPVRAWGSCDVVFRTGDSVETRRLFGSIVEHSGTAKFLSLTNDF